MIATKITGNKFHICRKTQYVESANTSVAIRNFNFRIEIL